MALSRRVIQREIVIRFDDNEAFTTAFRERTVQGLEDGTIFAERPLQPQFLTLAQVKALVAGL